MLKLHLHQTAIDFVTFWGLWFVTYVSHEIILLLSPFWGVKVTVLVTVNKFAVSLLVVFWTLCKVVVAFFHLTVTAGLVGVDLHINVTGSPAKNSGLPDVQLISDDDDAKTIIIITLSK